MPRRSATPAGQSGFSLTELLVGMLVALIATVIMLNLFANAETARRNVSGGGDAQSNGAIALFSLSRELRFAGYGMTGDDFLGCKLHTYNTARNPASLAIDRLAPVTIFPSGTAATVSSGTVLPAGDSGTDILLVVVGNANTAAEAVGFNDLADNENYAGYVVKNRVGFQVGDLVIAAESGKDCALMQVSALPGDTTVCNQTVAGNASVVKVATDSFLNPYAGCAAATSPYNPATAPVAYSSSDYSAVLGNLGNAPKIMAYAVRNHSLTYCNLLTTDCTASGNWSRLAAHIVGFKASYGWDTTTAADGYVDSYSGTAPSELAGKTEQCLIARVAAVRIGLLARNGNPDKAAVTAAAPTWQGGAFPMDGLADWQYYRYKVVESVVPLRNMVWKGALSGC